MFEKRPNALPFLGALGSAAVSVACAWALILAGCASRGNNTSQHAPGHTSSEHGKTQMAANAKTAKRLLYLSIHSTNSVYVYDLDSSSQVGVLTGFDWPRGLCVDKGGDVWITDYIAKSIKEFARGEATATKSFSTQGNPIDCSINPTNGDLAVANFLNGVSGNIEVWPGASGNPALYSDQDHCAQPSGAAYDSGGNLYFMAQGLHDPPFPNVCELPAGGGSLRYRSFDQKLWGYGSIMWDGKYIAIPSASSSSFETAKLYRVVRLPSGDLKTAETTDLTNTCNAKRNLLGPSTIVGKSNTPANTSQGTAIVGLDDIDAQCSGVKTWTYPNGGNPTSSLSLPGGNGADGIAISIE